MASDHSPIVGRDRHLRELSLLIDAVRHGRGSLVLLSGDAGVGKTRLAEAAVDMAGKAGVDAWWTACWSNAARPLSAWLEHVEIDADAPPNSPRTTDKKHLRGVFEGVRQGGVKLRMDNLVVGTDRAACTITCEMPDGGRLVSNTIYDLEGDKIVRQLDVQVMTDPESS